MGYQCSKYCTKCKGFLTDREQRKVRGVGILYVLGFPILILMIVVGAIKATAPGEENPNCPAEPNMPWFLVLGGMGITCLLLVRIALNSCLRFIKNNQTCCYDVAGCFCEFSCNLIYDIVVMVLIVMWMITVSWWVFRHMIGPDKLYSIFSKEKLDTFRASLGDNDTIHDIQFANPLEDSYCDFLLYMVAFVLLSLGWIVLTGALIVFIADKIFNKIVCCRLCRDVTHDQLPETDTEQVRLHSNNPNLSSTTDL
eukprot:GFUD01078307.1.p1 GENE.GFUD01078307.1~~GFUD01078307.1.p1  ORF type:complete len:254 (+),score=57.10 GFUD01078307.1:437-1198(+)